MFCFSSNYQRDMNPTIDVAFRITGRSIPVDHGYCLYSALSRLAPLLHQADWLGIHPIEGNPTSPSLLALSPWSRLRFRLPAENIAKLIFLSGKRLELSASGRKHVLHIGVPEVYPLKAAASLYSHYVAIKLSEIEKTGVPLTREMFVRAIEQQLKAINITGDVWIDDGRDSKARELSRRILRIKNKTIVCYSVQINKLSSDDSLLLQEAGLGGRRRMGCGLFQPIKSFQLLTNEASVSEVI